MTARGGRQRRRTGVPLTSAPAHVTYTPPGSMRIAAPAVLGAPEPISPYNQPVSAECIALSAGTRLGPYGSLPRLASAGWRGLPGNGGLSHRRWSCRHRSSSTGRPDDAVTFQFGSFERGREAPGTLAVLL